MAEPELRFRFEGVDKKEVAKFTVVYKDVYSWAYLYKLLHEWLADEGYCSRSDEDFREIMYEHLERPFGAEVFVRWRLSKEDIKSYKGLFQYDLDIDFHILGQKEVEVVSGGKKYKADKGEVEIAAACNILIDPQGKIKKHWLGKHFYDFVFKVFLKGKQKQHEKQIQYDMQRLQEAIKTYLKLETYLPERELSEWWQKRDQT